MEDLEITSSLEASNIEQTEAQENNQDISAEQHGSEESTPKEQSEAEQGNEAPAEDDLPKGVKKRFAKMTREKYAMQNELAKLQAQVAQMSKEPEQEYTREDFGEDEEAYLDHKLDQKLKAQNAAQQQAYAQQAQEVRAQQQVAKDWQDKIGSFSEELPDYAEKVANMPVDLDRDTVEAIKESEVGPKIAYLIATDEKLAEQYLRCTSQRARDRFITKLEIKLESAPAPAPKKAVSKAPAPAPKMGGGKGGAKDPNLMNMDEFTRWRNGE